MNINELTKIIGHISMEQPNINSFYEGDVYDILDNLEIKYSTIIFNVNAAQKNNNSLKIDAQLYYVDRLLENQKNKQAVYDDAVNYIGVILNILKTKFNPIAVDDYNVELFTQQFADLCAGGFVNVTITIPPAINNCGWQAGFTPVWEEKKLNITKNGEYIIKPTEGMFLERVVVDTNVLDNHLIVDDELDDKSINPVQNKIVTNALKKIPTKTSELKNDANFINSIASNDKIGGVKPIQKTSDMNLPVGVDNDGKLFTYDRSNLTTSLKFEDQYFDVSSIVRGDLIYASYKFDDDFYYLMSNAYIYKVTNSFELVDKYRITMMTSRSEAGYDRNYLAKSGDILFVAACYGGNVLYRFDEVTKTGKFLDTPGLNYYGSVYLYGDKIIYAHRYQNQDILIYNLDGDLLKRIKNIHGSLKITDGVAFCPDGYIFNMDLMDFESTPRELPYSPANGWLFANGNAALYNSYGFCALDYQGKNPTGHYTWKNLTRQSTILFAKNIVNNFSMMIWNKEGCYVLMYPYGPTNPVGRKYEFIGGGYGSYNTAYWHISNFDNLVVETMNNNIIKIEDLRKYGYKKLN